MAQNIVDELVRATDKASDTVSKIGGNFSKLSAQAKKASLITSVGMASIGAAVAATS